MKQIRRKQQVHPKSNVVETDQFKHIHKCI